MHASTGAAFARATPATATGSGATALPATPELRSVKLTALEVVGNEQVADAQVLDLLAAEDLRVGAVLLWPDDARVRRAQARLLATGSFERATIKLRPVAGADEGSARLEIEVEERGSLAVTDLYLGTSRMTPFHGGFQVLERNFLGRAIRIGGGLVWGTLPRQIPRSRRQQALRVFIEAPRLRGTRFGLGGTLYVHSASEPYRVAGAANDPDPKLFRAVDYGRVGGLLGTTFAVTSSLVLGVDYRFERVNAMTPQDPTYVRPDGATEAVDLDLQRGVHLLTSANFGLNYDGREEAARLGKGMRFAVELQLSSPLVGSSYEYMKLVAGGAYTFRLPWKHWITPSLVAGQIAGRAPRFERFYAGDLSDWTPGRELGIIYSTRGPIDVFGTGVDTRLFGSLFARFDLEYVWPLFTRNRVRGIKGGALFWSTGVFTFAGDATERKLQRAAGGLAAPPGFNANFGLRLETAIGTVDLSVGNVLRRAPL